LQKPAKDSLECENEEEVVKAFKDLSSLNSSALEVVIERNWIKIKSWEEKTWK